jgi:hypothetical protein
MLSTEHAITRCKRDMTLGALLRTVLLATALAAVLVGPFVGGAFDGSLLLVLVGIVWLVLSYRSVRGSRIAADSPSLIAAGQFEAAERRIGEALHAFSLFRNVKLLSLHHLALLRHAQQRWQETAMLCRALLRQRLGGGAVGLGRSTQLILTDSLLELDDLRGAHESLARLYEHRLSLAEALKLLGVQLDYLSRIGAWDQMLYALPTRVQMCELMSATNAAQSQALLALASRKANRAEWADFLQQRAALLVDPQKLIERRPVLRELWQSQSLSPLRGEDGGEGASFDG